MITPGEKELPMSEAGNAGVHQSDLVQVLPALLVVVVHGHQLDQILAQKVLSELDLRMFVRELIDGCRDLAGVSRLSGREGSGRDIEGEELGVDGIDDGGDEGGHHGCGGVQGCGVLLRKVDEFPEVGNPLREGVEGGGVDVLNFAHCCGCGWGRAWNVLVTGEGI